MRKCLLPLAFFLVFLLPILVISSINSRENILETQHESVVQPVPSQQKIRVKKEETVLEMELDTYVLCVLLGEVPAEFELEALKAQAVATRTYTLRKVLRQNKHDEAHICTNASCCQAFLEPIEYLGDEENLKKMESAVAQTSGQVLTYQGNLIEATYFSCSGGVTEDAAAVWGTSVPYLISVLSPGEENAKYYESETSYSSEAFLARLGLETNRSFSENDLNITYTAGGGVDQMKIWDTSFGGTQLRTLLGLPSTAFDISVTEDRVVITTKGYGHRVGMSQYGADAMAVKGKLYEEILEHYYPGTRLTTFSQEEIESIFDKAGNL